MNKQLAIDILSKEKKHFDIEQFVLFGSFVKETHHHYNDIDIAYILKDGSRLSYEKYLQLEERLSHSLKAKIDLMNFKKLNPLIKLHAQKDFIYV